MFAYFNLMTGLGEGSEDIIKLCALGRPNVWQGPTKRTVGAVHFFF